MSDHLEMEDAVLQQAEIPKDGVLLVFEKDTFAMWMLGEPGDSTEKLTAALYRLISYRGGNADRIARDVDGITGRVN